MAAVNRQFTVTLLDPMWRVLRSAGFRKQGQLFRRSVNDVLHLVQLQKSRSSTAALVRATVNLAVWVPALAVHRERYSVAAAPCRERLGTVMPSGQDAWWEMSTDAEGEAAGLAIVGTLQRYGLPWLNTIESTAALLELWESGRAPGLTVVERGRFLERLRGLRDAKAI